MSEQNIYRGMDEGTLPTLKKIDNTDNLEYAKTKFLQQKCLFRIILGLVTLSVIGFITYLYNIGDDPTHGQLIVLGMVFSFAVLLLLSLIRFVFDDKLNKTQRHWTKSFLDECLHVFRDYVKKV